MVQLAIVCIFVVLNFASIDADLPKYITKCKRSDPILNECLTVQSNIVLKNLLNGEPALKIPQLAPVKIPTFILGPSDDFRFEMTNIKGYGFDTFIITDLKMDLEKQTIAIKMESDFAHLDGDYNISGVLNGKTYNHVGSANLAFVDIKIDYSAEYAPTDFDGKSYLQAKNPVTIVQTNKKVYTLRNSNNQEEAAELTKILNQEGNFGQEIIPRVNILGSSLFSKIINAVLRSTPVDELFES